MRNGYSGAWMVGLMVAPHTLTVVGNIAGTHQGQFLFWIAAAAILYWINARSAAAISAPGHPMPTAGTAAVMRGLSITSHWSTAITLSTVLLVTSGFSFNETFLYWFPNFAFAYILLGLLVCLHLMFPGAAGRIQIFLVSMAMAGLAVLVVMGIRIAISGEAAVSIERSLALQSPPFAILLLFIGFDLVSIHAVMPDAGRFRKVAYRGIISMAILLGLWGLVSFLTVPADKLADSFIPHNIAARHIGGEMGRRIMGIVTIAGSLAAVNALFAALSGRNPPDTNEQLLKAPQWDNVIRRPGVRISLAAVAIAMMMALGVAGEEVIDTYVRAGLIVWLFFYGSTHLALLSTLRRADNEASNVRRSRLLSAFGAATMFLCGGALIFTDANRTSLLKFLMAVLPIAVLAVGAGKWFGSTGEDEKSGSTHRPSRLNG